MTKLAMPNARNLNYPLSCIERMHSDNSERAVEEKNSTNRQILVVRKDTNLPGLGIARVAGNYFRDRLRTILTATHTHRGDLQSKACERSTMG